jgi:hypothetical protein
MLINSIECLIEKVVVLVKCSKMHDSDKLHSQRVWPQPNFTIGDLKNAIPKHCFHRSFWVSTKHLLGDLATILCTLVAMNYLNTLLWDTSFYMWLLCWIIYVPYQGVNMMAAWVLAHECGHGALYNQPWLNDVVGYLIHTALFVPYFPWYVDELIFNIIGSTLTQYITATLTMSTKTRCGFQISQKTMRKKKLSCSKKQR